MKIDERINFHINAAQLYPKPYTTPAQTELQRQSFNSLLGIADVPLYHKTRKYEQDELLEMCADDSINFRNGACLYSISHKQYT